VYAPYGEHVIGSAEDFCCADACSPARTVAAFCIGHIVRPVPDQQKRPFGERRENQLASLTLCALGTARFEHFDNEKVAPKMQLILFFAIKSNAWSVHLGKAVRIVRFHPKRARE